MKSHLGLTILLMAISKDLSAGEAGMLSAGSEILGFTSLLVNSCFYNSVHSNFKILFTKNKK